MTDEDVEIVSSVSCVRGDEVYPNSGDFYMRCTLWGWNENTGKEFDDRPLADDVREIQVRDMDVQVEITDRGFLIGSRGLADLRSGEIKVRKYKSGRFEGSSIHIHGETAR